MRDNKNYFEKISQILISSIINLIISLICSSKQNFNTTLLLTKWQDNTKQVNQMNAEEKSIETLGKIKKIFDTHNIEYWLDLKHKRRRC